MTVIVNRMMALEKIHLKGDQILANNGEEVLRRSPTSALVSLLQIWATESSLPIVLLIDEIDSLVGDSLVSILRQLRTGYNERPKNYPQSIILCGVRDVRDYRIHAASEKEPVTGGSCFNVNSESLRIGPFSRQEVRELYLQHTIATGQSFTDEAINLVFDLTNGQPWLVNALAYEACFKDPLGKNRNHTITADMMMDAKESLIIRRVTHLDQLADGRVPYYRDHVDQSQTDPAQTSVALGREVLGQCQRAADSVQFVVGLLGRPGVQGSLRKIHI